MFLNKLTQCAYLHCIVTSRRRKSNGVRPELGIVVARLNMHVGRLA